MSFFIMVLVAAAAFAGTAAAAPADTIVLTFDFLPPTIEAAGAFSRVTMGDLPLLQKAGEPALPYRPVRVLIPDGRAVRSVRIRPGTLIGIDGRHTVEPAAEPVPLSYRGPPKPPAPNSAVYASGRPYPASIETGRSAQRKGPYEFLLLNLHPVVYLPSERRLSYYERLTLEVALEDASPGRRPRRPDTEERDRLQRKIENPEALESYDGAGSAPRLDGGGGPPGDFPHVIITSAALEGAPGPHNFQALRDHRTARGMPSTIVTTEYIYANFDGARPSGGSDNQTRIRNFIAWAHENWGTRYVLLGGAVGVVPARLFYVLSYPGGSTANMPVDMYYGNLDGTFDHDADGVYGEPTDGPGGGEVDLYAEVYIGRACVENATEVANLVRKTIAYETSTSDSLRRAVMVGEHLGFGGVSEYATESMEEIRLGSCAHGYCTKGFADDEFFQTETLYDAPGYSWPKSALVSIMNEGVHVLNHLGHANYTFDMKLYTSDLPSLANTEYFFIYSQGCNPGGFDTANCFAESVTTMEKGAVAAVMNARYGWGAYNSTAGPSQYYDREFWDALFGEGIRELGRMNADSKEDNDFRINNSCMRWCLYELNLFGDPAVRIQNISSRGRVSLDADRYPLPGSATVTVVDADLDLDPGAPDTATAELRSATETAAEILLLTETGPSTKTFRGTILLAPGPAVPGDGILQAADGDALTARYLDADDGTGSAAWAEAGATADASGPAISNIQAAPAALSCTLTFGTDEPATAVVRYGTAVPPGAEAPSGTLATSHAVRLRGLDPETTYYFEVVATDGVGNAGTDDNGGAYHQFTTLAGGGILLVDDDEGDSHETYFKQALDAAGYGYDAWDVKEAGASPDADDLSNYGVVIWNCGYNYSASTAGLTTAEQAALASYMDGGGRVFLCGQDILYKGVAASFRTNYLRLAGYSSDTQVTRAMGIDGDRISGGMDLALSYPFTDWSDTLTPDSSSSPVFRRGTASPATWCAVRHPKDGLAASFRIVFFAFPFEAIRHDIAAPNNAATVMDRVLRFLSPVRVDEVSPPYGLNDRSTAVAIRGAGFRADSTVTLGGAALGVDAMAGSEIAATVPAGLAAGAHDLVVRNADSLRGSLDGAYTALAPGGDEDGDGLTNEEEIVTHGTNPLDTDTDGDGLPDSDEILVHGTDPLNPDTDGDGLPDGEEIARGTSPFLPDTDGDGVPDFIEVTLGSDPLDPASVPGAYCVNFQPPQADPYPGFIPEAGAPFGPRGCGWTE
ncbi:MAG: C25 family cysteine peptidase [bacterium]|nr:C25 family cysteine peptidase [bacterium]